MNNERIQALEDRYKDIRTRRKHLSEMIQRNKEIVERTKKDVQDYTTARSVLTTVAMKTRENFKSRVEGLVTMAIRSVFDRPFRFVLKFEESRNKAVAVPVVMEGENEYIPKDDLGGGIIDLISFAFRVVLWTMTNPRSRSVFILDEPMKWVGKGELLEKAGQMLRRISHKLNVQLIIVTHEPELAEIADRSFLVTHKNGLSTVTLMGKDEEKILKPKIKKRARTRKKGG